MKSIILLIGLILLIIGFQLLVSCKKDVDPALTTAYITNITNVTATSGGTITDEGSGSVVERGVCWDTLVDPTIDKSRTSDGAGSGTFTSNISGLSPAKTYYVRAYATNHAGTGYGTEISFTTLGQAPTVSTENPYYLATTYAELTASVNANFLPATVLFEYGTTTDYGLTVTPMNNLVTGNTFNIIKADIYGLTPGTLYHYRVVAVNSKGTTNGNDVTFTTISYPPQAMTLPACCISATSAILYGTVSGNLELTTVTFDFGTSTSYGSSVAAVPGSVYKNTDVSATISGLIAGTTYHFRLKAENSYGTGYGSDYSFTTLPADADADVDVDGNVYHGVTIGTQTWMAENLKTTKYSDGISIPLITDSINLANPPTPACYWYDNDPTQYKEEYGALYNWYAVKTGKLCPTGWHVPSEIEFNTLIVNLGGMGVAGGKLKEAGTVHWETPNTGATNETGFKALPGGERSMYENYWKFDMMGTKGNWWSSTENTDEFAGQGLAGILILDKDQNESYIQYAVEAQGCSVRCIKN